MTDQEPSPKDAAAALGASAELVTDAIVVDGTIEGVQTVSAERTRLVQKAEADAHKRQVELAKLEHQLDQERKDNDARRDREAKELAARLHRDGVVFWFVFGGTIGGLLIGVIATLASSNETTQRWGQALVTLIIGGLVGYFTGSKVGR